MKSTHIANGSHHAIWAMCDCDRTHVTSASLKFKEAEISVSQKIYHVASSIGFTKIIPGCFTRFNPGNSGPVYVSIFYQEGVQQNTPGPLMSVCEAFPIEADHSVIVDLNNQVRNTEHGKIWVDISGKNYFRNTW